MGGDDLSRNMDWETREAMPYYAWTQINADKVNDLSKLAHDSPRAFAVLMALRANAGGENACVCSARVLADCLNVSTRRIYACIAELRESGWLVTLRSGCGTVFVLNGDITWHSYGAGKYYSQLKANVVVTLDEQSKEMQAVVMQQAFCQGMPNEVVVGSRTHSPFQNFFQLNDEYIGHLCGLVSESAAAAAILISMVDMMDKHNALVCTYNDVILRTGICKTQVCTAIELLKRYGYIAVIKRGGRSGGNTYAVNHQLFWRGTYSGIKNSLFPPGTPITGPCIDVHFGEKTKTIRNQKIPPAVWRNELLKQKETIDAEKSG